MLRIYCALAALVFLSTSVEGGTIRSRSGATARVANSATPAFQCLIDKLDASGYKINFMGGWRKHGSVRESLHPAGLALDINQYRRNVTRPRIGPDATAMASACGLIHGAVWRNADAGHFQLGGWAGVHHKHKRRYAMVR